MTITMSESINGIGECLICSDYSRYIISNYIHLSVLLFFHRPCVLDFAPFFPLYKHFIKFKEEQKRRHENEKCFTSENNEKSRLRHLK